MDSVRIAGEAAGKYAVSDRRKNNAGKTVRIFPAGITGIQL